MISKQKRSIIFFLFRSFDFSIDERHAKYEMIVIVKEARGIASFLTQKKEPFAFMSLLLFLISPPFWNKTSHSVEKLLLFCWHF
jgi:hypothetical protein